MIMLNHPWSYFMEKSWIRFWKLPSGFSWRQNWKCTSSLMPTTTYDKGDCRLSCTVNPAQGGGSHYKVACIRKSDKPEADCGAGACGSREEMKEACDCNYAHTKEIPIYAHNEFPRISPATQRMNRRARHFSALQAFSLWRCFFNF